MRQRMLIVVVESGEALGNQGDLSIWGHQRSWWSVIKVHGGSVAKLELGMGRQSIGC